MYFTTTTLLVKGAPSPPGEDSCVVCPGAEIPGGKRNYLIAVTDGCGGSGGVLYKEFENWTGARIASHEVGRELCRWFLQPEVHSLNVQKQAEALQSYLFTHLQEFARKLPKSSFVRSSMIIELPTTIAAITASISSPKEALLRYFWAGNTRGYYLGSNGLRQITWDDTTGNLDPYEDLQKDGILCNVANASKPFTIHFREIKASEPCIVFAASDGCFSYFRSPLELEERLLETLMQSKTPAEWEQLLDKAIGGIAGDDYTMQMAVIGFQSFEAVKAALLPRWNAFCKKYRPRLENCRRLNLDDPDLDSILQLLWSEYKDGFLQEVRECQQKQ